MYFLSTETAYLRQMFVKCLCICLSLYAEVILNYIKGKHHNEVPVKKHFFPVVIFRCFKSSSKLVPFCKEKTL